MKNQVCHFIRQLDEGAIPDPLRSRLLLAATCLLGGAGLSAWAYPLFASLKPSERAKALGGPVVVDVAELRPGELRTVAWRGKPVWLMRRTEEMIHALRQPDSALADPQSLRSEQPLSCANPTRSVRPDVFVAVGVCTHLGCSPILHLDDQELNAGLHSPGGFLCPCHGSVFDLAGRVVKNVPAPTNLDIPNYRFTGPSTVTIG